MYVAGIPTQFFDGLYYAAHEEYRSLVVVVGSQAELQFGCSLLAQEVVFVVYEVYLHARGEQCGYLDNKRMVGIINLYVEA